MQEEISVGGNIWDLPDNIDDALCGRIAEKFDLPLYLANILYLRGIGIEEIENFIDPKLQNLMPDPYVLKDMQKAAERLAEAIEKQQKIAIIGDYDVDGATSTSVMYRFFRDLGIIPQIHIPSREEGYGPSDLAFDKFKDANTDLVITVDCGTTSFDVLNRAAEKGWEIIVIDHHEAEIILPKVYAVVNPKRLDEDNPYEYLQFMSAVGVCFMTLVAVNRVLREHGFYNNRQEPQLMQLLDLVALGTVCDVVPLLGLNRAYVKQGLKVMSKMQNVGLKHLMQVLNLNEPPSAYHLGFALGPRINACGRVGDASLGSRLLCSENEEEAQMLAEKFNQLNMERKEIEHYVLLQAIEQVEKQIQEYPMAFVYGHDWHQGVIGIVAGKLKERYNVPAFVMSVEQDEVKGSARSVEGIDLGALIISAKEKGLLTGGGGHIMAAGFSLTEEKIPAFAQFVGEYIVNHLGNDKVTPIINIDAVLNINGANEEFADSLSLLEPYGTGNPEPQIMIPNVLINKVQIIGNGHLKCLLYGVGGGILPAIAFRAADNEIGNVMLNSNGCVFDVVGHLKCDIWMGRKKTQLTITDIMRKK